MLANEMKWGKKLMVYRGAWISQHKGAFKAGLAVRGNTASSSHSSIRSPSHHPAHS